MPASREIDEGLWAEGTCREGPAGRLIALPTLAVLFAFLACLGLG